METSQTPGSRYDDPIDLMGAQRRRRVLRYLRQSSTDRATIDDIVDHFADDSATDPETIRIDLHHRDLPKIAACDVIEYDSSNGDIRYCPTNRIETPMDSFDND